MEFVKCDYHDLAYSINQIYKAGFEIKFVTETVDNGRFTYTLFYA